MPGALDPATLAPRVTTAPMSCASVSVVAVAEDEPEEEPEAEEEDEPDPEFDETEPLVVPDMRACFLPE